MVTSESLGKPNNLKTGSYAMDLHCIPSRGTKNAPRRFMLQKPDLSAGLDEPVQKEAEEDAKKPSSNTKTSLTIL